MGGQGRCERRTEVFFFKIKKKNCGGQVREGGGVRVDVNGELKLFENSNKYIFFFGGEVGSLGGGQVEGGSG